MNPSSGVEDQVDRIVYLRPAGTGVRVRFFALVIRLDALHRKYQREIHTFFREAKGRWEMDGVLCATTSMTGNFDGPLALLEACGMQCGKSPVDFFLVEAGLGTADPFDAPHCLTLGGDELSFSGERGKMYCRLKYPAEQ